jgi:hypothetical protein
MNSRRIHDNLPVQITRGNDLLHDALKCRIVTELYVFISLQFGKKDLEVL